MTITTSWEVERIESTKMGSSPQTNGSMESPGYSSPWSSKTSPSWSSISMSWEGKWNSGGVKGLMSMSEGTGTEQTKGGFMVEVEREGGGIMEIFMVLGLVFSKYLALMFQMNTSSSETQVARV